MTGIRYRNPAMKQLADQQLRFAPVSVRMEQVGRAEELAFTVNTRQNYSYPDLCEKLTKYRAEMYPNLEVTGEDLLHDLRRFIEDLSDSANLIADAAPEPVLTLQDLSKRFNVSEKTVKRWRDRGLAGRRYLFGKRKRVGFLTSLVEQFEQLNSELISRSSKFTQVTNPEREFIVRRARRLARYGASPTEVTHRLARRTGRAVETIRYTLKAFDEKYSDARVFPNASQPLSDEHRRMIFKAVRNGTPIRQLVEKYGRTRSSIHRIVNEYRAKVLIEQPIDYIPSDEFVLPDVDELISELPVEVGAPEHAPIDSQGELPGYFADLYALALLTREEERQLFRRMNYLKFKAKQLRDNLAASQERIGNMNEIERLLEKSLAIKNVLIRSNLRLVVSVARKHRKQQAGFFEMISDGNMTLIRAIEKFDYLRGTKFSTYATWAIMRSYARSIPAEGTQLERFRTGTEVVLIDEEDSRPAASADEKLAADKYETLGSILGQLNEREQEAISLRFALHGLSKPMTLEQIGDRLGVSKERTRQIINTGLEKLRQIAGDIGLELSLDD
ncbi:MAG: sigma-70 family RNA polymerase sigma factor [Planctomycetaceae bacterium]|nr:sigma-70 family RNA polymerase sigma factor [Planctomycetaceae bacterium]